MVDDRNSGRHANLPNVTMNLSNCTFWLLPGQLGSLRLLTIHNLGVFLP